MSAKSSSGRIRVGLMGFGRIGRNFYRLVSESNAFEIPVISDVGKPEILHYLLQRDTVHGSFEHEVALKDHQLLLDDGRQTELIRGIKPKDVPWNDYNVDVVIDATGKYLRKSDMQDHLSSGSNRVIVTSLPDEAIDRIVADGVNEDTIVDTDQMISAGSSTTSPTALILKILHHEFGLEWAMMTTIHAYTSDQPLADTAGEDYRRSRSAAENIIPNDTPTAKWLGVVLPEFKGKFDGIALNVPVPDGSCVDLTCQLAPGDVSVDAINNAVRAAAKKMPDIIEVIDDPIVSSDVIGNRHSLVFDAKATMKTSGRFIKVIGWYDNGWGHAARLLDIIRAYSQLN
jgi:glyceraldehyde 3-phosphate dehydrogenase